MCVNIKIVQSDIYVYIYIYIYNWVKKNAKIRLEVSYY